MDVEDSLRQKPREVCITEDTDSIDLVWFDNTELNPVKKWAAMFVGSWHWAHLRR